MLGGSARGSFRRDKLPTTIEHPGQRGRCLPSPSRSLKGILTLLNKHHQRATYGAVAGLVGRTPQTVLQGCPRNWLHSWVVNQESGEPTAYPVGMVHPSLKKHATVLRSEGELGKWLDERDLRTEP